MSKKILNNKIPEFRQKKGVTQEELASLAGVSRQTIISKENFYCGSNTDVMT